MLAEIKPGNMQAHVGTPFEVLEHAAGPFSLIFTGVDEQVRTERQEIFSLNFHGPASPALRQGIYKLKHAQLGEFELFLVPIARDKDGFQYEAAFNNIIGAA